MKHSYIIFNVIDEGFYLFKATHEDLIDFVGGDVSRETFDALTNYVKILLKWQDKINLISPNTVADVWKRHVLDSVQIVPLIKQIDEEKKEIYDIGSGAGFPGLVEATFLSAEGYKINLVESDNKKSIFLREVSRECNLGAVVHNQRIEKMPKACADIVTARALSSLLSLLDFATLLLKDGGVAVFHKGKNVTEEIEEARKKYAFEYELVDSLTDSDAKIIKIWNIKTV